MKALLLIAHGSRRQQSNDEVVAIADKLKNNCGAQYRIFQAGFLELSTPSISESIEQCVNQGATSITLLPYFLNSGTHVTSDIPHAINQAKKQFPDTEIKLATHIGASPLMMTLLIEAANSVN
ncbi:cobalamin biosynthesis protein CbiX [Psychromonas sp. psych-6C06]|nr:cobalamin biosynthesis protein CbiX [Psychromonas sp. psych-6C06]